MPLDANATAAAPRRRNERSRVAIIRATKELLRERGFDALSIEAVAARAGVGKQTIYRWWPGRPSLVADVMLSEADKLMLPVPDTGDVRADLVRWAGDLAAALTTPDGSATVRILTVASLEDPEMTARLRETFSVPLQAAVRDRLVDSNALDPAAAEAVADAIVGGVVFRVMVDPAAYSRDRAEAMASVILTGTARR